MKPMGNKIMQTELTVEGDVITTPLPSGLVNGEWIFAHKHSTTIQNARVLKEKVEQASVMVNVTFPGDIHTYTISRNTITCRHYRALASLFESNPEDTQVLLEWLMSTEEN